MFGARMAGAALGVITQFVLARAFAPADVGHFFLVMSVCAIVSLIITGGYPALAISLLARYYTLGRHSLERAFLAASWRGTFVLTALTALVVLLFLHYGGVSPEFRDAVIFGSLAALPYAVMRLNSAVANAQRRFTMSYVPDFVYRSALLLAVALAGIFLVPGFSITHMAWSFVAITALVTAYQAWVMGRDAASANIRFHGRSIAPFIRHRAAALFFVAMITMVFADIVTILAGYFLPAADVAVLGIAIKLAALIGFVTQSSQQFIVRDLATAMTRGKPHEVDTLLFRVNIVTLGVMAAALLGSFLLGELVLGAFGRDYRAGFWPLVVFLASQALRAAGGMNSHLLALRGYQTNTALSCGLASAVLVAAIAYLSPRFGIIGVAYAVLITDAVWALHLGLMAQRLTGRRADILAVSFSRAA
jgi:O-antigen/teichoic acid export membrane protein